MLGLAEGTTSQKHALLCSRGHDRIFPESSHKQPQHSLKEGMHMRAKSFFSAGLRSRPTPTSRRRCRGEGPCGGRYGRPRAATRSRCPQSHRKPGTPRTRTSYSVAGARCRKTPDLSLIGANQAGSYRQRGHVRGLYAPRKREIHPRRPDSNSSREVARSVLVPEIASTFRLRL